MASPPHLDLTPELRRHCRPEGEDGLRGRIPATVGEIEDIAAEATGYEVCEAARADAVVRVSDEFVARIAAWWAAQRPRRRWLGF